MKDLEQRFERMRTLHQTLVYNYLFRSLGDREEASDALSETFRRAHRYLPGFREECTDRAWLMSIAANVVKRTLSSAKRRRHVSLDALAEQEQFIELPGGTNIERAVILRHEVERFLQMLPPEQRSAVWMREALGMTDEEVAEALGVPVGTVKSWVWRSMARLRKVLAEELAEDAQ